MYVYLGQGVKGSRFDEWRKTGKGKFEREKGRVKIVVSKKGMEEKKGWMQPITNLRFNKRLYLFSPCVLLCLFKV